MNFLANPIQSLSTGEDQAGYLIPKTDEELGADAV